MSSCRCVWVSVPRLNALVCAFLFTIHLQQVHDTVPHASLVYHLDIGQFACVGGVELDLFESVTQAVVCTLVPKLILSEGG